VISTEATEAGNGPISSHHQKGAGNRERRHR
jgi:hypothetical protein